MMPEILYTKSNVPATHNCHRVLEAMIGYRYYTVHNDVPRGTIVRCDCGKKYVRTNYDYQGGYFQPVTMFSPAWWRTLLVTTHSEPEQAPEIPTTKRTLI